MFRLLSPAEIKAHLDEYVIGQEDAKKVLSVAVYNHYKRANYAMSAGEGGIALAKSNILMVGPTGSGKTHITNTLAKVLSVPFVAVDSTTFLTGGIKAESILSKLIQGAGNDIQLAERGIIYIDEVDKISKKYNAVGEQIQQALLRFIEGSAYSIPLQNGQSAQIDTTNILFIVGGAFVGLAGVVQMRMDTSASIRTETELIKDATPADFAGFGFIPEFIGRLPVIVSLEGLSINAMIDILTKPKNSLVAQYKKILELDGIELIFADGSLEKIAEKALAMNTGARGLRGIIEDVMRDIMFKAPGEKNLKRVTVTVGVVEKTQTPIYEYLEARTSAQLQPVMPNPPMGVSADI
jgi:ATP-dependent Clp protease ATP-binding subunit ClpX